MLPQKLTTPSGKEAELFRRLPNGRIQCTACARLCQIAEGQVGLCGIRGVVNGKLYLLAYGKIITGHIDPIEKKPVVHYRPGSKIFSVATTGCNWLCNYCFLPETAIMTDRGLVSIQEIYNRCESEDEIGYPKNLRVVTHSGLFRQVMKAFRHEYHGKILRIRPYYLPEIMCTPNHKIFTFNEKTGELEKKRADELNPNDLVAVPKVRDAVVSGSIDAFEIVSSAISNVEKHDRRRSAWILEEEYGYVRFRMSRSHGIPRKLDLSENFAEFLGLYCAEGSSYRMKSRPNSWVVTLAFGSHETELIERTAVLLYNIFGAKVSRVHQANVTRLTVTNSTLAIFLHAIAGGDCYSKRVPTFILHHQSPKLLEAFLKGYIQGDGSNTANSKKRRPGTKSVSRELSLGVWYLMFRLGGTPRLYLAKNQPAYKIEGGSVSRQSDYSVRVMLRQGSELSSTSATKIIARDDHMLVPIRDIRTDDYSGYVYNLEVEGDHSYSANFMAVSNCQNFDISQRRKIEGTDASPADVAAMAASYECEGLAYTYNQPTIFIEYARDIGRIAREKGIFNIFVSNGFDTPEAVGMMKDFLDCVTVDFKGSGETGFVRRYIGIPNADPIYQTLLEIRRKTRIHIEITDLIVPSVGDNIDSARKLSKWIYENLGPDTPIHFLRFHPDYKMMDLPSTPVETLEKHYEAARAEGLKYAYIGNVPGHPKESTYCPGCGKVLIGRHGYEILEYNLNEQNRCKFCDCKTPIVGPLSKSWREERFIPVV